MLGIEHLLHTTALEVRMVADDIDKGSPGHPKQERGAVHVNRAHCFSPCRQSYHGALPDSHSTISTTATMSRPAI